MAVLQKYVDQGISVNTSYNPVFYEDEKISMSEMLRHLMIFYKFGGKQLYYFNTYDGQGELDIDKLDESSNITVDEYDIGEEEACETCVI